ncbi:ATP-binding protein [Streptomyces sp. NPDC016562]|uniref:ATP-binding protein n=1 Tax=Streptomyces sp. NPDC016562 TaxID=3364966 RepID=UPI0036F8AA75
MNEPRSAERSRVFVLGPEDENVVTRCRDFTRRVLTDWDWLPTRGAMTEAKTQEEAEAQAQAEDVLLLVSEVVANARLHGGGPSSLLLRRTADGLRIEVTDRSPAPPVLQPRSDLTGPGGHGLLIVDRLARRWGSDPLDGGKRVWLEVAAPRPREAGAQADAGARSWWSRRWDGAIGQTRPT